MNELLLLFLVQDSEQFSCQSGKLLYFGTGIDDAVALNPQ
jgi:hypothetical protein